MKRADSSIAAIEERASEWLVQREGGLTPAEQAEFDRWLEADPRHFAVFADLDATMAAMKLPREGSESEMLSEAVASGEKENENVRRHRNDWRQFALYGGMAAALVVGFFWFQGRPRSEIVDTPSVATMRLKPEQRKLPDGSVVELNAGAEITVDYQASRRGIRLVKGEAHFDVMKDPARPFIVAVGNVEVRAVGTAFVVRLEPTQVEVLVTDGRVAVATATPPAGAPDPSMPVFVSAGSQLQVPADGLAPQPPAVQPVTPLQMSEALAWREMRFEFTNVPLIEAVELFNKKSHVKLVLGDADLADIRVSGIYWADNPNGFAHLIEAIMDVEAERDREGHIVLRKRQ